MENKMNQLELQSSKKIAALERLLKSGTLAKGSGADNEMQHGNIVLFSKKERKQLDHGGDSGRFVTALAPMGNPNRGQRWKSEGCVREQLTI